MKTLIQGGRSWLARMVLTAFLLGILMPVCHAALPPRDGNGFFKLNSGRADYWGYYPENYDENTPVSLFIWMHGCGGQAYGDLFGVAPYATRANQSYIAISLGGRDGVCWQTNNDADIVRAALNHVSTVFNINPRKIYIGGYSSGGDMAYRFGFENSTLFAGILGHNSSPFRDTGRTGPQLMAAARWKINVAHLLHTEDATYPPAGVRAELATLAQNGFPVNKEERPGTHFDNTLINGTYATIHDQITYLLPYLDKGWTSPAPPVISGQITVTKGESLGEGGELLLNDGTILDFGSVAEGNAATIKITLQNGGPGELRNIAASTSGAGFSLQSTPPATLVVGGTAAFLVKFSPSGAGTFNGKLVIASTDGDDNPFSVDLKGAGTVSLTPEIAVAHGSVDLLDGSGTAAIGRVHTGRTKSLNVTVRNTGNATLSGLSASVTGRAKARFSAGSLPTSLEPGASANLEVRFSPTASGQRSATLVIASNDADENPFEITLTGIGVGPEIGVFHGKKPLVDGKSTLSFGNVRPGEAKVVALKIRNGGAKVLAGIRAVIEGKSKGRFQIVGKVPRLIQAGKTAFIRVKFLGGRVGASVARLRIVSNDADERSFDVRLAARVVRPTKKRDAAPAHVATTMENGLRYKTITAEKRDGIAPLIEVSSDLVNWRSGGGNTETISETTRMIRVRDLTPVSPGNKRFVRARNP